MEKKLFILEHHFKFPYLTESVQHGVLKPSFPGTDRYCSQLGCNDLHVSIMYGHATQTRLLAVVSDAPQKSGVSAHAQTVDTKGLHGYKAMPWYVLGMFRGDAYSYLFFNQKQQQCTATPATLIEKFKNAIQAIKITHIICPTLLCVLWES